MTSPVESEQVFFSSVAAGREAVGFFWRGGAVMFTTIGSLKTDQGYMAVDSASTTLAERINSDEHGGDEFVQKLKDQLDALCGAVDANTITLQQRAVWMVNIWALIKSNKVKNDNNTGLQYLSTCRSKTK